MSDTKELEEIKIETTDKSPKVLFLHNDDTNTFEFVEVCLQKYCNHSKEQAMQCALRVHYKGKCDIKKDTEENLKKIHMMLKSEGLIVSIENE